jgi:hypothetical protein
LVKRLLVFFIWHFLAFPASNGYNSYFDRDEQSIALLEKPPEVDISLYYFSLFIEVLAFGLGLLHQLVFRGGGVGLRRNVKTVQSPQHAA